MLKKLPCLLKQLIIKRSCLICSSTNSKAICQNCYNIFPYIDNCCLICSVPLLGKAKVCGKCNIKKPMFNKCIACYSYSYPIKQIIYLIKYHARYKIIKYIINQLIFKLNAHYNNNWPQIVIPVPMYKTNLLYRGFNQAQILTKEILKGLPLQQLVLEDNLVVRNKKTEVQHNLTIKQRKQNIRNAFAITRSIKYNHVAIVDDVVTSGATVTEITKLLKKHGVQQVDIWCLARAPL